MAIFQNRAGINKAWLEAVSDLPRHSASRNAKGAKKTPPPTSASAWAIVLGLLLSLVSSFAWTIVLGLLISLSHVFGLGLCAISVRNWANLLSFFSAHLLYFLIPERSDISGNDNDSVNPLSGLDGSEDTSCKYSEQLESTIGDTEEVSIQHS